MSPRHVLMTGAAGRVGTFLREHWRGRYRLRLADVRPVEDAGDDETIELDITDLDAFTRACEGIDTVLHLAADPSPKADFYESLLQRNIIGGYNGFEAARLAGCRRIVFASSINAVLGYGKTDRDTTWEAPLYPQNVYGATKCWGEALGRVYDDQHGLSCLCVRLASPSFDPAAAERDKPENRISEHDAAALFGACIDAVDDVGFAIVHGVSDHVRGWFRVSSSDERIAYTPAEGTRFL